MVMSKLLTFSLATTLCGTFAAAQQMGCLATTGSVIGSYTYVATELPFNGVGFIPPGTNQQVYSSTTIGKLLGNVATGTTFSSGGVLYFDGAGHISVSTAASPLAASTAVGTYTVNSDCTINVTLTDVFNTTTASTGVLTMGSTSLIGLILGGGTEIDLSAAQSTTSTNGNTPLVPGEFVSRLSIQLIRSFTSGCSVSSLTGAYGLIGDGFALVNATTTSTGTTQPVTFVARLTFDGNGNVIAQPVVSPSPLASFQYTGTYTVNLDCSGTISLIPATAASSTGTVVTTTTTATPLLSASFVLIPPVAYVTTGSATLTGSADRPSLLFTVSNSTETLSGYGRAQ